MENAFMLLDDAAMGLIVVLIVMALKEIFKPSKAITGVVLLGTGAVVGVIQQAALQFLPQWVNLGVAYGLAVAIFGGTAYGLISRNKEAQLKKTDTDL